MDDIAHDEHVRHDTQEARRLFGVVFVDLLFEHEILSDTMTGRCQQCGLEGQPTASVARNEFKDTRQWFCAECVFKHLISERMQFRSRFRR